MGAKTSLSNDSHTHSLTYQCNNDPWVTLVWVIDGNLHCEHLRASECHTKKWIDPSKVTSHLIFEGKINIVDIKVTSHYTLERNS